MPPFGGMSTYGCVMGANKADMAIRLVEERVRIGYSQADFARKLNTSRETLRRYEIGERVPTGEFLAQAIGLGIDVQYVLTGVRSRNLAEAEKAMSPTVEVLAGGTANIVQVAQAGTTVNMVTTQKHITRTVVEAKPGEDHISEEQKTKLAEMVKQVVELEEKHKKTPRTHRAVWGALNAHCGVTTYKLIAKDDFEKAEKYLRQWMGRIKSMRSAPVKDNMAWRRSRYAYIKINTKGSEEWLTGYLKKNFKAESIADISDDELDRTYRAVAHRKRSAGRK